MKRLTEKDYCGHDVIDRQSCTDYTDKEIFKVLQKLGQLEDIMEKYNIKDLDELEYKIESKNEYLIDYKVIKEALRFACETIERELCCRDDDDELLQSSIEEDMAYYMEKGEHKILKGE